MNNLSVSKTVLGYLQEFGLNEKEIVIYLTLLKIGPSTIMDLARKTSIKRSTTHNNVEELIKKGLVSQTNYGERRMVIAESPEKLKFLLEQRKWEVNKLETNMEKIVSEIFQVVPSARENSEVEVKYYTGKEGTSLIYKEAFSANELRSYVNLAVTAEIFPENNSLYLSSHKKNPKAKVWEIVENTPEAIKLAQMYVKSSNNFQFKTTEKILTLSSLNTLIYDGKVAIINFKEDNITGTVIRNPEYYNTSKIIFEMLWDYLD